MIDPGEHFDKVFFDTNIKINRVWDFHDEINTYYASTNISDTILMFSVPFGFKLDSLFWSDVSLGLAPPCKSEQVAHNTKKPEFSDSDTNKNISFFQSIQAKINNHSVPSPTSLSIISSRTNSEDLPGRYIQSPPSYPIDKDLENFFKEYLGLKKFENYMKNTKKKELDFNEFLYLYYRYTSTVLEYNAISFVINPPESFDPRIEHPECFGLETVMTQGDCGSCWAISLSLVISYRTCIKDRSNFDAKTGRVHSMSPAGLTTCGASAKFLGCNGLTILHAAQFATTTNFPSFDDVPDTTFYSKTKLTGYSNVIDCSQWIAEGFKPWQLPPFCSQAPSPSFSHGQCKASRSSSNIGKLNRSIKEFGMESYYQIPTMQSTKNRIKWMKHEISTNGPIPISFDFNSAETNFDGETVEMLNNQGKSGDTPNLHAAVIIGFEKDEYFLIMNTWGAHYSDNGVFKVPIDVAMQHIFYTETLIPRVKSMTSSNISLLSDRKSEMQALHSQVQSDMRPNEQKSPTKVIISFRKWPMKVELKLKDNGIRLLSSKVKQTSFEQFLSPSSPNFEVLRPEFEQGDIHDVVFNVRITVSGPTSGYLMISDKLTFPLDEYECSNAVIVFRTFVEKLKSKNIDPIHYASTVDRLLSTGGFIQSKESKVLQCFILPGLSSQYSFESFNSRHYTSTLSVLGAIMHFTPYQILHPSVVFKVLEKYSPNIFKDRSTMTAYFVSSIRRKIFEKNLKNEDDLMDLLSNVDENILSELHALKDAMEFFTNLSARKAIVATALALTYNKNIKASDIFDIAMLSKYGSQSKTLLPYLSQIQSNRIAIRTAIQNPSICKSLDLIQNPALCNAGDIYNAIEGYLRENGSSECVEQIMKKNKTVIHDYLSNDKHVSNIIRRFSYSIFDKTNLIKWGFKPHSNGKIFINSCYLYGYLILKLPIDHKMMPKNFGVIRTSLTPLQLQEFWELEQVNVEPAFIFRQGFESTDSLIGTSQDKELSLYFRNERNLIMSTYRKHYPEGFTTEFDIDELLPQDPAYVSSFQSWNALHTMDKVRYYEQTPIFDMYCLNSNFDEESMKFVLRNFYDKRTRSTEFCAAFAAHADKSAGQLLRVLRSMAVENKFSTPLAPIKEISYLSHLNNLYKLDPSSQRSPNFAPNAFPWLLLGGFDASASQSTLKFILEALENLIESKGPNKANLQISFNSIVRPNQISMQFKYYIQALHPNMVGEPYIVNPSYSVTPQNIKYLAFNALSVALLRFNFISNIEDEHDIETEKKINDVRVILSENNDGKVYDESLFIPLFEHIIQHPFVFLRLKPSKFNFVQKLRFSSGKAYSNDAENLLELYFLHHPSKDSSKLLNELALWFLPAIIIGNIDLLNFIFKTLSSDFAQKSFNFMSAVQIIGSAISTDNVFLVDFFLQIKNHGLSTILSRSDTFEDSVILQDMIFMLRIVLNVSDEQLKMKSSLGTDFLDTFIDKKLDNVKEIYSMLSNEYEHHNDLLFSVASSFIKNVELKNVVIQLFCHIYASPNIKYSIEEQIPFSILATILSLSPDFHKTHTCSQESSSFLYRRILKISDRKMDDTVRSQPHSVHPIMCRAASFMAEYLTSDIMMSMEYNDNLSLSSALLPLTSNNDLVLRTRFHAMLLNGKVEDFTDELLYSKQSLTLVRLLEGDHSHFINILFPIAKNEISINNMKCFIPFHELVFNFFNIFEEKYNRKVKQKWNRLTIAKAVLKAAIESESGKLIF